MSLSVGYGIYKDNQSNVSISQVYSTDYQEKALENLENEYFYEIQSFFNQYTIDVCLF